MQHSTNRSIFLFLLLLLVWQGLFAQKPSKRAVRYFENVANIIKSNYFYIDSIDFLALKSKAKTFLLNAKKTKDTYPAIDTLLYNLYDKHSYFWRPRINKGIDSIFPLKYPTGYKLTENVAYIKVPPIVGHHSYVQYWADSLRNVYNNLESENIKGWIIDLRGNFGGDIHPMLTGLYPFFGDTIISSFQIKNIGKCEYIFSNGFLIESHLNNPVFTFQSYKNSSSLPDRRKVAVLIDNKVASSGEIVLIAFCDRPNTKTFGSQTAGIPTIVRNWALSDNAFLGIVVGEFLNKQKQGYQSAIKPNVYVAQRNDNSNFDETITKALEYLLDK
jgi:carboxyl-terminal processing protease